jgi:hypothetical protein
MLKGGLFYSQKPKNPDLICFSSPKLYIEFCDESEEGKSLLEFIKPFAIQMRPSVFYHDEKVFKFCDRKEYGQNIDFLRSNPGITPELIASDDEELIIITKFMRGYKNLKEIEPKSLNREQFERELKLSLLKMDGNFFLNDLLNLSNIGYNGKDVIFFEQTGGMNDYETKEDMIRVFMNRLENEDKKYKNLFK